MIEHFDMKKTETLSVSYGDVFHKKYRPKKLTKIKNLSLIEHNANRYKDLFLVDEESKQVIANFVLSKESDKLYRTSYSLIKRKNQGFEIAPKVYEKFITHYKDFTFVADNLQSSGGMHIWNKLAKNKNISVSCVDRKGNIYECEYGKHGIECEVDPYSENFQMIAQAKKK